MHSVRPARLTGTSGDQLDRSTRYGPTGLPHLGTIGFLRNEGLLSFDYKRFCTIFLSEYDARFFGRLRSYSDLSRISPASTLALTLCGVGFRYTSRSSLNFQLTGYVRSPVIPLIAKPQRKCAKKARKEEQCQRREAEEAEREQEETTCHEKTERQRREFEELKQVAVETAARMQELRKELGKSDKEDSGDDKDEGEDETPARGGEVVAILYNGNAQDNEVFGAPRHPGKPAGRGMYLQDERPAWSIDSAGPADARRHTARPRWRALDPGGTAREGPMVARRTPAPGVFPEGGDVGGIVGGDGSH
ncbi:hypothetical protein C8J57DRAFT_1215954 [Mycena rebaudengoi]|nr:hypothetical protein C8J57DRAFT_1215954 [Mycena rebaudengoi]